MKLGFLWNYITDKIKRDFPNVPTITTTALAEWLNEETRNDPLLLDVRAKTEFDVSHLCNAIHAPDADAVIRQLELHSNQGRQPHAVLYCSVGYRSAKLVKHLTDQGINDVFNLEGSIFQWFNEDRPVFLDATVVAEVHPYSRFWKRLLRKK